MASLVMKSIDSSDKAMEGTSQEYIMGNKKTQKEIAEQIENDLDKVERLSKKVEAGEINSDTTRTSAGSGNTFRPWRWSYI